MAMEINGSYNNYRTSDSGLWKAEEENAEAARKEKRPEAGSDLPPVLQDEYVSSEKSGIHAKPSGLYRLGQDENGNPKVLFDDPKKADKTDGKSQPEKRAEDPDKPEDDSEKCTGNTDRVDREIEKLKEEKARLEQQIKMASGDEEKTKELKQKLTQIENELRQKDNDNYRKQHTVFY